MPTGDKAKQCVGSHSLGNSCALLMKECVREVNEAARQHESQFETLMLPQWELVTEIKY